MRPGRKNSAAEPPRDSHDHARFLRRAVAAVLLLGMLGVGAELVLIEHVEGWSQQAPLLALGAGVGALAWDALAASRASRLVLRLAMLGLVIAGAAGVYLHYESNEEFQRELDPSLRGWPLALATLRAHSPPSLAPAVLGLLGTLGWLATTGRDPTNHDPRRRTT